MGFGELHGVVADDLGDPWDCGVSASAVMAAAAVAAVVALSAGITAFGLFGDDSLRALLG